MTYYNNNINVNRNFYEDKYKIKKKANTYKSIQEKLRNKALLKGVDLLAPETIFLSTDTVFGKNVVVEPYVVIGPKVKLEIMLLSNLLVI